VERRRLAALLVIAAILLIGAWPLLEPDPRITTSTEAEVDAVGPAAPPKAAPTPQVAAEKREPIPRPKRVLGKKAHREGERRAPQPQAEPTVDTAVEKGGVDPSLPLTADTLKAVADRMRPSIAACLDAWTAQVPQITGRVLLGFNLGPDGVQSAWVEEHEDVPTPVLGCFSAAVYEQDWPAAPDGVMVTFPFVVEAGVVPDEPGGALEDKR
jgi:hypothetical protein